jgi:glycosyltransferase involved in cell wall biosynthesis
MTALSILIPSRHEEFLQRTIQDILAHIEGDTEVIAVLDGYLPDPPLISDPRLTVIYHPESIGQRAATNEAAKISQAKYVAKCDAHCAFDQGFDVKMMAEMKDDWTMVPVMRNLHIFDWVCPDGHRRYQGISGVCKECGKETVKDIVWIPKHNPQNASYCFDAEPHFQYFGEFSKRLEGKGDITPTMSLQGSFFMCTREKYFELNLCDEEFGSWGSQGLEVAIKTWLSGGQVMANHKTWYAHMFRTQGGDFGFPYSLPGSQVSKAKHYARDLFFNNKWPKQVHSLSWLVEKFWPVKGWTEDDLRKLKEPSWGIIYYTDNQLDPVIMDKCQRQLKKAVGNHPIVSSSLKKMDFGTKNIHFPSSKRGYLTMAIQILSALEHSKSDYIFFCEHDVLYHPSHFDFIPPDRDTFYYNQNVWLVRVPDGHGLHYDVNQLSGLCGYRDQLIIHFRERVEMIKKEGFSRKMGFEPMTHGRIKWQTVYKYASWKSMWPNIDLKHGVNATGQRWRKDQYRNQQLLINWQENDNIPGWGHFAHFWKRI